MQGGSTQNSWLQVHKKVGISKVEVYKKGAEICHLGIEKGF